MQGTTLKLIVEMDTQDAQRVIKSGSLANLFSDLNISTETNIESEAKKETVAEPQQTENKTVPTTTMSYTLDELQRAAISLMDKGLSSKDLTSLLSKHGASSLPELSEDNFGAFALDLRQMGAEI